jgi:mycothiol system anti-sigma-R factor
VSVLDRLKRLFGSGGLDSSQGVGSQGDTAGAMISCEEASARLFEYLDGELESVSEEEVRGHLEVCERCYPRVEFEKHFLEAIQRSQNGGRASASLKEKVLRSLAEEPGRD